MGTALEVMSVVFRFLSIPILWRSVPWGVRYFSSNISWDDVLSPNRITASGIIPDLSNVPSVDLNQVDMPPIFLSYTSSLARLGMVTRTSLISTSVVSGVHLFGVRGFIFIHPLLTRALLILFSVAFDVSSSLSTPGI